LVVIYTARCEAYFLICWKDNGELWTWGNSEYGQGMLSRKIDRVRYQNQTSPQIWPFLIYFVMQILEPLETNVTGVKDIAAGGPFSIILKGKKYWSLRLKVGVVILISFILENGTVYGCGYGAVGLGDDIIETLEPTLIPFDEEVTRIFATQDMAAAITGKSFVTL
jgi:alpha-tubulin suppressor-like RCC1 family protein